MWLSAEAILLRILPEPDVAVLAGQYLKVMLIGAPGYALFESGKRYLQAQGVFSASLYVLLICAPLNAMMNWLFVWVSSILSRIYYSLSFYVCMLIRRKSNSSGDSSAPPSP